MVSGCRTYYEALIHEWHAQRSQLDDLPYSFDMCCHRYQLSFLDYVRFLIGAMWGSVTTESCESLHGDINQGMHKRSAGHLAYMVSKADMVLQQLEAREKNLLSQTL